MLKASKVECKHPEEDRKTCRRNGCLTVLRFLNISLHSSIFAPHNNSEIVCVFPLLSIQPDKLKQNYKLRNECALKRDYCRLIQLLSRKFA